MEYLFWISGLTLAYIYLGYPLMLKYLPKQHSPASTDETATLPKVSVLIPAFNEAKVIAKTIKNKLEQNYPAELIEILVISDESDDGTDQIVADLMSQDERVKLVRQSPRQGKTSGLNLAVPQTTGEILVFSDANSQYHPDAIRALVNCFSDPEIGYVTGKMVYTNEDGSLVGDGCSAYMKYENHMRRLETQIGSVIGVDGGIDAMRKSLFQAMNPDQLPDFVQPLKVVTQGKRVAFCEEALLNEEALTNSNSEFRMRVRVSLRAYWAMWDMKHLFNPFRFGIFSLQLLSHKLLRYLAFFPLFFLLISNAYLTGSGLFYQFTLLGQIAFYCGGAFVALNEGSQNRFLGLAHYFCLINIAAAMAFLKFLKGEKIVTWKPRVG